jgi:hypothetical protein
MYFRDMAELSVLKPEQEFETARHIEELELRPWRDCGTASGLWLLRLLLLKRLESSGAALRASLQPSPRLPDPGSSAGSA